MINRVAKLGRQSRKSKPSTNGHAANGKAAHNGHAKQPPAPLDPVGDGGAKSFSPAAEAFWEAALDASMSIRPPANGVVETVPPSLPTANGKDPATGRFQAGNKFGRGNPHARRQAEMHQAFMAAITPEGMQSLAVSLWMKAKLGDVQAAQLVLHYMIGRPASAPDPDRLDLDEWRISAAAPTLAEVLVAWADGMRPDAAASLIRMIQAGTHTNVKGIADTMPPDVLDAAGPTMKRITRALAEMENDDRGPTTLQVGTLRKSRCKRGGKP